MTEGNKRSIYTNIIAVLLFLIFLIALKGFNLIQYPKIFHDEPKPKLVPYEKGSCPSLDEMLEKEFEANEINVDDSLNIDTKEFPKVQIQKKEKKEVLTIEKETQENSSGGIRIVLRYDDKDALLRLAKIYGLSQNYRSSVPYYFVLNSRGEKLYFNNRGIFEKFLHDIGGEKVFRNAQKEISVRLVSGKRIEVISYF